MLIKQTVEFGEFDIKFLPRITIKAHVVADFWIESTIANQKVVGGAARG